MSPECIFLLVFGFILTYTTVLLHTFPTDRFRGNNSFVWQPNNLRLIIL